ncbi:MAG TPA: hypothetical protein VIT21_10360 [Chthoniobacterales bacterium]
MQRSFARRTLTFWSLMLTVYVLGYLVIRATSVEKWERDGQNYVIFPASPQSLYYIYRPMAQIDGKVTGMRFRHGPHPK